MDCDICAARSAARVDPCGACGIRVCRACERHCVIHVHQNAQCARCARPWDARETVERLGRTFVNTEYRRMRRTMLIRTETARLPGTVERARQVREEEAYRARVRGLQDAMRDAIHAGRTHLLPELYYELQRLHARAATATTANSAAQVIERCGAPGCDGVLDADTAACRACGRTTCRTCGVCVQDEEEHPHVCDPQILASRRLIMHECRPCVRCRAPSQRTEGCPVMWCCNCHAFWNWDTGRLIETRSSVAVPHNPDHRDWLHAGGAARHREVDDIPCGGLPDGGALHTALVNHMLVDIAAGAPLVVGGAEALHSAQRMRVRYPREWNEDTLHEDARVAHLNGKLGEAAFANTLERTERAALFKRDVGFVLETFVLCGADLLQRFCASEVDCDATAAGLARLREVIDAALQDLASVHARRAPRLTHQWRWELPHARRPRSVN